MLIRPANQGDCEAIARIQVDSYRSAYSGILPPEYLERFSCAEQEADWLEWFSTHDPRLLLAALSNEGEVIGYGLGQINQHELPPFDSELVGLHVHKQHQRRGLGSRLFSSLSQELASQGCKSLFLWVLENNPARIFYEKLGGKLVGVKPWQNNSHFGADIQEVAYGWMEIKDLIRADQP